MYEENTIHNLASIQLTYTLEFIILKGKNVKTFGSE